MIIYDDLVIVWGVTMAVIR